MTVGSSVIEKKNDVSDINHTCLTTYRFENEFHTQGYWMIYNPVALSDTDSSGRAASCLKRVSL